MYLNKPQEPQDQSKSDTRQKEEDKVVETQCDESKASSKKHKKCKKDKKLNESVNFLRKIDKRK